MSSAEMLAVYASEEYYMLGISGLWRSTPLYNNLGPELFKTNDVIS